MGAISAFGGLPKPWNPEHVLSGHPVVVLPVGWSTQGLPMGVQLVGRRWGDPQLLDVAAALDRVIGDLRSPPAFVTELTSGPTAAGAGIRPRASRREDGVEEA